MLLPHARGLIFPTSADDLPPSIKEQVADFDFNFIELKTGRNIQFVRLNDVQISGTELRKWLRIGKNVDKFIPLSVEGYIKEQKLYKPPTDKIGDYQALTEFCGQVLFDKKGIAIRGFDQRKAVAPSEFSLVASGTSTRHASAMAENVMAAVKEEYNVWPQSVEGIEEGRWVLVDYGSLIVHIFYDFVRQEYQIENLWRAATDLNLKDNSPGIQK